jgi:protein SCO1/2
MNILKQTIGIVLLLGFVFIIMNQDRVGSTKEHLGGDFEIPSTKGIYKLKEDKGKVVILYFGYRFCPDVCPTTLSALSIIYDELKLKYPNQVKVVFISVDVERDNLKNLKNYIEYFDKSFIAGVDSKNNIDKITNIYGVKYSKFFPKEKEEGFYTVDHSAEIFIIGKDGFIKDIVPHGEENKLFINKIIKALEENIKDVK